MEINTQETTQFNLLDEPWIKVRNKLGQTETVSITEVFRRAHELECLEGDLPTQDVAILRLLLAFLYAVFIRVDSEGNPSHLKELNESNQEAAALQRWKALWDMPTLPMDVISAYLEFYRERFWLVHPVNPFYQVAGLQPMKGNAKDTSQMIADVPSRIEKRFFSLRFGLGATELTLSEAARWLVTLQAWDYAGKKAVVTDSNGNRGSENGGGTGWLGKLGVLHLRGTDLRKTLLLNLALYDIGNSRIPDGDPIWEEAPRTALKVDRPPAGYVELLTQQTRRVFLTVVNNKAVGVTISYGDVFEKDNLFIELMSAWHESSQSGSIPSYIPTTHKSGRSLWRDLSSLLPQAGGNDNFKIAGILEWASVLKRNRLVDMVYFNVAAIGIEYGSMQGVVNNIIADELSINAGFFVELAKPWVTRIISALDKSDKCINRFGWMAQQFAQASGSSEGIVEKALAQESAYYVFDSLFRNWLASLSPETDDLEARMIEWQDTVYREILRLGQDMYESLSSQAIIGRFDQEKSKTIAAPVVYMQFKSGLNKILKDWKEEFIDE